MSTALTIRFPEAMWAEIEAIQAARIDAPDKASIIRELVAHGLAAMKARGTKR
jgi:hypothetical protein